MLSQPGYARPPEVSRGPDQSLAFALTHVAKTDGAKLQYSGPHWPAGSSAAGITTERNAASTV